MKLRLLDLTMAYKRPHSPVSPPPLKRKVVSSASSEDSHIYQSGYADRQQAQ